MDDGSTLLWLIVVLLLFLAAFFAACETAYSSVSTVRLRVRADRGEAKAQRALKILDDFDLTITSILICINIVHLSTASLVTVLVTRRWGFSFVGVSTVILTLVMFFAGEMLPKVLAKKYSERLSLAFSGAVQLILTVLRPLAKVLSGLGRLAASSGEPDVTVTEDELYDIIEDMTDDGSLRAGTGELVHSALEFGDITVGSILTPRVDLVAVDASQPRSRLLPFVREQRHSRLPVYEGTIDNIIGILQIRRYIKACLADPGEPELRALLEEPYFIHQSAKIDEVLPELSRRRQNLAVVTDSYGGTVGIVTVEDILEELVGEIWDEDDVVRETSRVLPDGSVEADASVDMEDAFALAGFEDPTRFDFNHKLLGEWVYEQLGRLPREGDVLEYHGLTVRVAAMRGRRLLRLQLSLAGRDGKEAGLE
ncbi:MAG: hemolysin family protein [Clostridiales bacterium]|nr:hemolysin family protein [Clostridiales bacterium]